MEREKGERDKEGGVGNNEWLIGEGYRRLGEQAANAATLDHAQVDWSRTTAWAEGGYYARVFLNIAGREPNGTVAPADLRTLRDKLCSGLANASDDAGIHIPTSVRIPEEHYRQARGFPPDLMVYFDDLRLRAIGSIGGHRIVALENDTGPDSCNHDWDGIFVMSGGGTVGLGRVEGAEIGDVAPTILGAFEIPRPPEILGRDWTR